MSAEGTAASEGSLGKSSMVFTIARSAGQRSAHLGNSESRSRAKNFQSLRIFRANLTGLRCGSPDIKLGTPNFVSKRGNVSKTHPQKSATSVCIMAFTSQDKEGRNGSAFAVCFLKILPTTSCNLIKAASRASTILYIHFFKLSNSESIQKTWSRQMPLSQRNESMWMVWTGEALNKGCKM